MQKQKIPGSWLSIGILCLLGGCILAFPGYRFSALVTFSIAAVILLYVLILVFEFFIPGAAAKALLLIPMLTLAPLPGISVNIIILAFLFGDGYTNVLYPTCATLVVGLGLAEVSYVDWLKKTGWFQAILFLISAGFLLLAVYIGL